MTWHIGNTTVRTPYRLSEALKVLAHSNLHGDLLGNSNEQSFAKQLHENGVLVAERLASPSNDVSDLGRKWRVALSQLGFVTPHFTLGHRKGIDAKLRRYTTEIEGLTGCPYEITPNGMLLIESDLIQNQQYCFLKALASYRIPSPIEPRYESDFEQFSPLRFVLEIFQSMESIGIEPTISFNEMSIFVQQASSDVGSSVVAERIGRYRSEVTNTHLSSGAVTQRYMREVVEDGPSLSSAQLSRKINTLRDYADLNLRYLKATGLFSSRGRGITISPEKVRFVELITSNELEHLDSRSYLHQLWCGTGIPSEDTQTTIAVIRSLDEVIRSKGRIVEHYDVTSLDIERLRLTQHTLEAHLQQIREEEYALQQVNQVEEIVGYMDALLQQNRRVTLSNGVIITIPQAERAAYLEWVVWRAFLAINCLVNKPWEARRFQVDQDSLPIGHAPSGGPDMSFEFQDSLIVVEVTLTSSSRQEAAEGEPVRRHVAKFAEDSSITKPVYGLFIAPTIDTNTAHTFRSGDWYMRDDNKINLHIVPMMLSDFRDFFNSVLAENTDSPGRLNELLQRCRMQANQDAPQWKESISRITRESVQSLAENPA